MSQQFAIPNDLFLLRHPFYQAWIEGTLPAHALKDYAEQYYHHVEAFPRYIAKTLEMEIPPSCRNILSENLAEEDGSRHGISHPELWLRFAEGVGAAREDVKSTPARSAIRKVVDTFLTCSQVSLPQALGVLYAYESQVPEIAESKIDGLKRHFHIQDARTLAFFEVHKEADVLHRESIRTLLEGLSVAERAEAQNAADTACRVLWDFLSDVYEKNGCACA